MGETRLSTLSLMGIHYARTVDINEVAEEFIRVHPSDCLTIAFLTELTCYGTLVLVNR